MSTMRPATWTYAEEFVAEPELMERARQQGEQFGASPVGPGTGPALRAIAAAAGARSVVEIGSGAGVSGLWLLSGMPSDGILTTIDINPEHSHAAKRAYADAGVAPQRTRTIVGSALVVMARLADSAYDLVLVDGDKREYPAYVEQALRLLRRGGTLLIDNMLWHDKVADPAVRDEVTTILRDLGKQLRDDPDLVTTLLPVGDGLLMAVKR
ncbi:O-methyltransferase [Calidifontibacter sp. DB0510]|uniref:O-methyltransferase n=1 Tax=Metallococcus carri TaxID=1656884 RepID=A0A967B352_9MICO|nr:O-methyltransferase [Metallococcus carri]NHN56510.1 O-methyltransferase [Metallococcus carri]NOP36134.1 O-methyltransferase [Calidifontibacter sp. DB2511S]